MNEYSAPSITDLGSFAQLTLGGLGIGTHVGDLLPRNGQIVVDVNAGNGLVHLNVGVS